jgi:hypothetical protein
MKDYRKIYPYRGVLGGIGLLRDTVIWADSLNEYEFDGKSPEEIIQMYLEELAKED